MKYDEERTVTKNPDGEQKEVIRTETNYVQTEPQYVPVVHEQRGFSGASVALMVIAAVSVVALLFVLFMNNRRAEDENTNREVVIRQEPAQQQPVVVQQPAQQPPVVVQQPAQQPPVIVGEPSASSATSSVERDLNIQTEIEKRLDNDETFKAYDITTTVLDGKVTLIGTVDSEEIKMRIERMVNQVRGVKQVDNKLIVSSM